MRRGEATITLVRGGGGVFEVAIDGRVVFAKAETGRFPTEADIAAFA